MPKADLYTVSKSVLIRSPRRTLKRIRATLWTYGDPKTRERAVEALDDIDHRLTGATDVTTQAVGTHRKPVCQLNVEAVSLHACPSLPATPLACDHDHGDRRRDRMRGLRDAEQQADAPDRDGDGTGRQRLPRGRQALPGGAREGRRGGATSLDRRLGGNRCPAARAALGRERRHDPGRRRRHRDYGRSRIIGYRGIRAFVVVPQAREPGRGG